MTKIEERPVSSLLDISGRKAIVTGGAMGLGFGIAKRLAEAGADVLISDINEAALEKAAKRLSEMGYQVDTRIADSGREEDNVALFKYAREHFGGVDILVNNAGIYPVSGVVDMPLEELRQVLSINVESTFIACREAGSMMIDQKRGGVIINLSSLEGLTVSFPGMSHYGASKAAIIAQTRHAALELGPHKIRVVAIAPGGIMTEGVQANFDNTEGLNVDEFLKEMAAKIPLGSFGHPDDIARVVLFLVSDAASYITGTTILIDGGALLV